MFDDKVKKYIKTQLEYDNTADVIPTNTQAMVKISHDLIVNTVKEFAKKTKVYFLDIGCGWGDFSNKLDQYIEDYIGVEPSIIELERFVKGCNIHNRYLIRGFGEYLDFIEDNSRNVILLNSVLDHCFDWGKTIKNCIRILAPGGLIIIAMENSEKITIRFKKKLKINVIHHNHLSHLCGGDLEKIFQSGFEIIEKKTTGFLFGFHYLTKLIPLPLGMMIFSNKLANKIFQNIFPGSGHLLYYVFLSKEESSVKNNMQSPFVCPLCRKHFIYGMTKCTQCDLDVSYLNPMTIDAIKLARKVGIDIPL